MSFQDQKAVVTDADVKDLGLSPIEAVAVAVAKSAEENSPIEVRHLVAATADFIVAAQEKQAAEDAASPQAVREALAQRGWRLVHFSGDKVSAAHDVSGAIQSGRSVAALLAKVDSWNAHQLRTGSKHAETVAVTRGPVGAGDPA